MARPRVFVSSTFYDLKHIRSSLDIFIDSLGYDSILSEKGDIAYSPEVSLDESCYREVSTADIFVLVIGGRYGSPASREGRGPSSKPFEDYDYYESVTKLEHSEAVKRDLPIYILVDSPVYAEYQTFRKNKDSKNPINYAHVDSANVFKFLEEILSRPRNNPIKTFERFSDIEIWLREQWAGLFREHLHRKSSQQQIKALADQVTALQEASKTLNNYLEAVVSKVSPDEAAALIKQERERQSELEVTTKLRENAWVRHIDHMVRLTNRRPPSIEVIRNVIARSKSWAEFADRISEALGDRAVGAMLAETLDGNEDAQTDFNGAREILGVPPINFKMNGTVTPIDLDIEKSLDKVQKSGEKDDALRK